ncbi:MAG: 30S ribosomal protein S21 [Candidatus Spechtbacteria bacterium]|nr:30S ribosomal protein S21 [Candidatus Spechtbacteria bacterium]
MTQKLSNIIVERKEREAMGALLRRFTTHVQKSGVIKSVRKHQFYIKPTSKNRRLSSALERNQRRAEYQKLVKLGRAKKNVKKGGKR